MKYKVLGGKWGEGYEVGQIIDIDLDAAKVRLELGELEECKNDEVEKKEVVEEVVEVVESKVAEEVVSMEEKPKRGRPKRS